MPNNIPFDSVNKTQKNTRMGDIKIMKNIKATKGYQNSGNAKQRLSKTFKLGLIPKDFSSN